MSFNHEWDWPPPRSHAPSFEGTIHDERIVVHELRAKPKVSDATFVDRFFNVVILTIKLLFGGLLGSLIIAAIWLISAVANH